MKNRSLERDGWLWHGWMEWTALIVSSEPEDEIVEK